MIGLTRRVSFRSGCAPSAVTSLSPVPDTATVALAPAEVVSLRGTPEIERNLLNALPEPAYVKDVAGHFLNQATAEVFATGEPAAAVGKTTAGLRPADLAAAIAAADQQAITAGEPVDNCLDSLRGCHGDERWLLTMKAPARDDSGEIVGIMGTAEDVTTLHETTQAALRQSEALFRAVWEASADAISLTDANGIVLAVNPAYCDLFGNQAEEFVGQSFAVVFPEAERSALQAAYRAVFAAPDPPAPLEAWIQRGDGAFRYIESRASFVEQDGVRSAMISMVRDVTHRKRIEAELRAAEERYRRLVEEIPVIAYTQLPGANGPFTYFSPQFETVMGFAVEEWTAHPETWLTRLHPDDREHVMAALHAVEAPEAFICEYRVRARDGRWVWFRDEAVLVHDEVGQPLHWQGVLIDISEQKRIEGALLEAEERFRGAFEAAAIGVSLVAPDGRFRQVNRALCDMLGYPEGELLTKTVRELTHPDDLPVTLAHFARLQAGEMDSYRLEKRYIRRDGAIIWAQLAVSVVHDHQGTPRYFVGQVEDVTRRKAAEAATAEAHARLEASNRQLEYQNTAKSAFVSVISHELRTPLTSIRGFSELIATEVESLAEAQAFATTINQSAERLTRLVNDVLDLDRMIAGHVEMSVRPINLNALVTATLDAFGSLTSHQRVVRLDEAQPVVHGDPDRLTQVVTNLVSNAIKYAPAGGPIVITTTNHPEVVELTVADQGLGVPAEYRDAIFDPYERIARPEQSMIAGTGLGLPITKHIVTLHGGRIWVEPNHPRGSVFHVVLPAVNTGTSTPPASY